MNQFESVCISLNQFATICISLHQFESFWILLNPFESFWILLNAFESFWILWSSLALLLMHFLMISNTVYGVGLLKGPWNVGILAMLIILRAIFIGNHDLFLNFSSSFWIHWWFQCFGKVKNGTWFFSIHFSFPFWNTYGQWCPKVVVWSTMKHFSWKTGFWEEHFRFLKLHPNKSNFNWSRFTSGYYWGGICFSCGGQWPWRSTYSFFQKMLNC